MRVKFVWLAEESGFRVRGSGVARQEAGLAFTPDHDAVGFEDYKKENEKTHVLLKIKSEPWTLNPRGAATLLTRTRGRGFAHFQIAPESRVMVP